MALSAVTLSVARYEVAYQASSEEGREVRSFHQARLRTASQEGYPSAGAEARSRIALNIGVFKARPL